MEGNLVRNEIGRYELPGYYELTTGSLIEFYDYNNNQWVKTSVDYDGSEYYLVDYEYVDLDGLKVRM